MTTRELVKHEPKLSVRKPGFWQNKFHSECDVVFQDGAVNKAGEWFSPNKWPSREVAEMRAQEDMKKFAGWVAKNGITYRGAIHFPEGGE